MAETPIDDVEVELLDPASPPERRLEIVRTWIGNAAMETRQSTARQGVATATAAAGELDDALEAALAAALAEVGASATRSAVEIRAEAQRLAEMASRRGLLVAANSTPDARFGGALRARRSRSPRSSRSIRSGPSCSVDCCWRSRRAASARAGGSRPTSRQSPGRRSPTATSVPPRSSRPTRRSSRARAARERGTSDPLLDARYETVAANLRSDQSRFREALRHARRARRIYAEIGQPHEAAKARIRIALQLYHLGEPLDASIREIHRALPDLRGDLEPRRGRPPTRTWRVFSPTRVESTQRGALLPELRRLADELDNPYDPARVEWLAAHIAALRGDYVEAERLYREVVGVWNAAGFEYDAALATLELTAVLLALGKTDEVRSNAEALLPVFRGLGIGREALATLQLIAAAARREALERTLVEKLVAQLRGRPTHTAARLA